jgi:diguanylate cyclase (GGDEF)-like protein
MTEWSLPDSIAQADDLPSMPGVVVEILRLAKDDDAGVGDFARVISGDPALAAKLLKLSNSSMFGVGQQVKTLDRACVVLGLKTVQLMALSFSLRNSLSVDDEQGDFPLKEYWARSLIMAVSGRSFSRHLNHRLDDEAFLCGLLSQIGQLVTARCMPALYAQVLQRSGGSWPTCALEAEVLGFDRYSVGAALLQSWELPVPICRSIAFSTRPDELPSDADDESRRLVEILQAAELTASVFRDASKAEMLEALREVVARSGLAEVELDALLDKLEGEIVETAKLLDVELGDGYSHSEILEEARQQAMRISLGAAADLKQAERRAHTLETENRALAEKVSHDELTGIPNRAGFDSVLGAEIDSRLKQRRPKALGLLMIDADHFKQFNDTHGHRAGDEVLRTLGMVLEQTTRGSDVPARYGGEEFAVIAPEVTLEGLRILAERVRQAIEQRTIQFEGTELHVTVSIGGACLAEPNAEAAAAALVEAADRQLYAAKGAGRNRVVIAEELLRLES